MRGRVKGEFQVLRPVVDRPSCRFRPCAVDVVMLVSSVPASRPVHGTRGSRTEAEVDLGLRWVNCCLVRWSSTTVRRVDVQSNGSVVLGSDESHTRQWGAGTLQGIEKPDRLGSR